jgi:hypothetical protein
MIFTTYCADEPIASNLQAARNAMSIEDQVDMEDALQRWGEFGPEDAHVYARVSVTVNVLARKVPDAKRFLVGVHKIDKNIIVAVSLDKGLIKAVVRPAFLYTGISKKPPIYNPDWTG